MNRHIFLGLCLGLVATACADAKDADADATEASEVRVSDVKHFTIRRSAGFVAPAPEGTCRPSGQWTVDLVNRTLAGTGCADGTMLHAERAIDGFEVSRLRAALYDVKSAERPEACPTDVPAMRLDLVRRTREDHYIEQRSACGSEIPATSESLDVLYTVVLDIAAAEPEPEE